MSAGPLLRVLIVEDEAIIAIMIGDMLAEFGCEIIGPAASIAEAIRLAQSEELTGAFLDVDLAGTNIYPVADLLSARRIPFVFVSGYGASGIDPRFIGTPVLSKPFLDSDLERALKRMRQRLEIQEHPS